jgi:hypothetical protein
MEFSIPAFLENVETNDFKIETVYLDKKNHKFELTLEGAYWFRNSSTLKPEILKGGMIKVSNYVSFEARYFDIKSKIWNTLDYEKLEIIDEINEKTYKDSVLCLAGMGRESSQWIEYLIEDGEVQILFEE